MIRALYVELIVISRRIWEHCPQKKKEEEEEFGSGEVAAASIFKLNYLFLWRRKGGG